jgi:hypothetical protein
LLQVAELKVAIASWRLKISEDLFTLALCEEFTLYLCLACHISHIRPQQKIWYLLRHTCGWGRALALALADYKTDRQQTWLLAHGLELRIFWPPLAPLIIIESLLIKRLQVESCSEKFYKQVVQVVIQYLLFLSPVEDEPEYKFGTFVPQQFNIDLADLLSNLLRLSAPFVVKPELCRKYPGHPGPAAGNCGKCQLGFTKPQHL